MIGNIRHWIYEYTQLVDNFKYDNNGKVIIPDDDFEWINIYGLTHTMKKNGMPPFMTNNNIINYYW